MEKIHAHLVGSSIQSNTQEAFALHKKSHFGEPSGEKILYSLPEALFLAEKGKIDVLSKNKKISFSCYLLSPGKSSFFPILSAISALLP